jgi:hypothetical protein
MRQDERLFGPQAEESNQVYTNVNGLQGNNTSINFDEYYKKGKAPNVNTNDFTGGATTSGLGANLLKRTNKNIWLDDKHPDFKNDPIYQKAIKGVDDIMKAKYPDYETKLKSTNSDTQKIIKERNDLISDRYKRLSTPDIMSRSGYGFTEDKGKELALQIAGDAPSHFVKFVNPDGSVSKESKQLSLIDNLPEAIKKGKIQVLNDLKPYDTGLTGMLMQIDGNRYVVEATTSPYRQKFHTALSDLAKHVRTGKEPQNFDLSDLAPDLFTPDTQFGSGELDENGEIMIPFTNSKVGSKIISEKGLRFLIDQEASINNPSAKQIRQKPPKGMERISGNDMEDPD